MSRSRARSPGAKISLALLLALAAVNGAAVAGLWSARSSAREAALEDLRLQTVAQARALEASLATLRGDLIFLTQAPPLGQGLARFESPDPAVRRWSRRDVEGALLLFLETHGVLERLIVRDPAGRPEVAAGRRAGAPVLLRIESLAGVPESRLSVSDWRLGGTFANLGRLEVHLAPDRLLSQVAPSFPGELQLAATEGSGLARAEVRDDQWPQPIRWTLLVPPSQPTLPPAFETLILRYRQTVILNLAVIALSLPLGALALRQIRRAAQLEAENEQQARLRMLEQQVRHSERLASLGRLAAGWAHEINNPLAGMTNYLTLLEEDLRSGHAEGALELADRVREGLDRVAKVTRGVLTFASPPREGEQAVRDRSPVDLAAVLDGVLDLLRADPAHRDIAIERRSSAKNPRVAGDATSLGQLFLNLLLNACQAQPAGGRVEVELDTTAAGTLRVRVSDRGPGFAPELADRMFEPFVSTRGSTGLGLAVAWGIVGEHGGSLRAENRPGGGAVFTVELPSLGKERS